MEHDASGAMIVPNTEKRMLLGCLDAFSLATLMCAWEMCRSRSAPSKECMGNAALAWCIGLLWSGPCPSGVRLCGGGSTALTLEVGPGCSAMTKYSVVARPATGGSTGLGRGCMEAYSLTPSCRFLL